MFEPPPVTISACLIVRNEAGMLDACLQSLHGVDDLVVVDTGSTDDTVAIAERHGARIGHAVWSDDFAAARNVSLGMARGEWVLVIDADHRLKGGIDAVRESIRRYGNERVALCPVIVNLDEDGQPTSGYRSAQAFRRQAGRRFVGRIHERIADDGQPLPPVEVDGWQIEHLGFTPGMRAARGKATRNLALLYRWVEGHPEDADAWYYLGAELQLLDRLAESRQAYERGLTAVPGIVHPSLLRLNLMGVLESQRRWPAVLDRVSAWRADGRHFPDFWLIAGRAAMQLGQMKLAADWFQQAAAFGPERPVVFETAGARTWKPAAYQALLAAERRDWLLARQLLAPWQEAACQDPFVMRIYLHAALVGADAATAQATLAAIRARPLRASVARAVDDVLGRFTLGQVGGGMIP